MLRVTKQGVMPQMLHFQDGMSAGTALAKAGISAGAADALSVNGRRATAKTPVQPGDTVSVQPMAPNG